MPHGEPRIQISEDGERWADFAPPLRFWRLRYDSGDTMLRVDQGLKPKSSPEGP